MAFPAQGNAKLHLNRNFEEKGKCVAIRTAIYRQFVAKGAKICIIKLMEN